MYLIVGLGNPEEEYARTRHNMGFDVINEIAKQYEIEMTRTKFNGIYGTGIIEGEKVILLKPQTYMNSSGESLVEFKEFYKLDNTQILVILDDIDLEPGNIRIKRKGSAGSHNGLKSVVYCLKSEDFARIRVGVGKPDMPEQLIEYVIGAISDEEYNSLKEGINKAKEAVIDIIKQNLEYSMNKYN